MVRLIFRCVKASEIRYLVDAGSIVASVNAQDQWHGWAVQVMAAIDEPVATSEVTVAEACHLVKSHRLSLLRLVAAVATGRLIPISPWPETIRLTALLEKYPQMAVGDASLVVLSEKLPKANFLRPHVRGLPVDRRLPNHFRPLTH